MLIKEIDGRRGGTAEIVGRKAPRTHRMAIRLLYLCLGGANCSLAEGVLANVCSHAVRNMPQLPLVDIGPGILVDRETKSIYHRDGPMPLVLTRPRAQNTCLANKTTLKTHKLFPMTR